MIAAVDGCKGGWLVAMSDQWPPQTIITATVCPDFEEVLKGVFDCSTVVLKAMGTMSVSNNQGGNFIWDYVGDTYSQSPAKYSTVEVEAFKRDFVKYL